jgi:hypothetical protein
LNPRFPYLLSHYFLPGKGIPKIATRRKSPKQVKDRNYSGNKGEQYKPFSGLGKAVKS